MFILKANKNQLVRRTFEPITTGSAGVYTVRFQFSEEWDGLRRTACFKSGSRVVSVLLDDSNECVIPWETTSPEVKGKYLYAGVYGTKDGSIVLPTIWASLGVIQEGVAIGEDARPPTPDLWEQQLDRKGDGLAYDGLELSLMSGNKSLSKVVIAGGGGGPIAYRFGHGLKQDGLDVSVDAVSDFSGDNTLPMTAAGVQTTVGNIEALLATI